MDSLPPEITLQILQLVVSSSPPSTLYNLLAASPTIFHTFEAHRYILLAHPTHPKGTVTKNTLLFRHLAAEENHTAIAIQPAAHITDPPRSVMFLTHACRTGAWDTLEHWIWRRGWNRDKNKMSMVEIDGMKRLAVEIRASLEEQRLWEGFLRRFGGREFGRREDKWAAARRRAFFGLARRSRRGKGNA